MIQPNKNKFLVLLLLCFSTIGYGQKLRFEQYSESDGISSKFCYTLNQDDGGGLIISTNDGILRFNGSDFEAIPKNDSIENNFARCSFKDAAGNIWFGHNQGNVSCYDGTELNNIPLDTNKVSRINEITQDNLGNIWVLTQSSGLFKIDPGKNISRFYDALDVYYLYSIEIFKNQFYLGTDMGLIHLDLNESDEMTITEMDQIPMTQITDIIGADEEMYLSTEDAGLFKVVPDELKGYEVFQLTAAGLDLKEYKISSIRLDELLGLWVSSENKGLLQLSGNRNGVFQNVKDYSERGLAHVKCINETFVDRENNLWIASLDGGLLRLTDSFFSFYDVSAVSSVPYALSACSHVKNELWIGSKNKVLKLSIQPWSVLESHEVDSKHPDQEIISLTQDGIGNLWLGSSKGRLYKKEVGKNDFTLIPLDENTRGKRINHLLSVKNQLFVSTGDGVFIVEKNQAIRKITLLDGLPDDYVNEAVYDGDQKIWFVNKIHGDGPNVSYFDLQTQKIVQVFKVFRTKELTSVGQDDEGNIWVGSKGGGLVKYKDETYTEILTDNSDLFKNYIYALSIDGKGQVWTTHRGGLSKIINEEEIRVYEDFEIDNFSFLEHLSITDTEGNVWFGTNLGFIKYNPSYDLENNTAPILHINSIIVNDEQFFDLGEEIFLSYKSDYKIEFDFLAVSLKNSDKVKYQYYLEGYQEDWQDFTTENKEIYNKLSPGDYVFKVRAVNADGVVTDDIKKVEFTIDGPFYYKWWFYIIVGFSFFGILRWVVFRRERNYKKNQEILERKLDERTKEVVEQKEILERTNNDITDSIEYAKKIQTAILPPPNSLNRLFTDAFVFYKPRDIVSGDFYWVTEFEETVLVACADCTGHGVPGAFMSLIGSALLKEITARPDVNSPAETLDLIDKEIQLLLNKEDSVFGVSDGMDMTLMEINKSTNKVKISSAKRPFVVIKDGQKLIQNGDRFSIGGFLDENKAFVDHVYDLNKGDKIYLYSDGIVDQFGGPKGKKLKHRGFQEIIDEMYPAEMFKQDDHLKKRFLSWINGYDQIDDIIVIGIEI